MATIHRHKKTQNELERERHRRLRAGLGLGAMVLGGLAGAGTGARVAPAARVAAQTNTTLAEEYGRQITNMQKQIDEHWSKVLETSPEGTPAHDMALGMISSLQNEIARLQKVLEDMANTSQDPDIEPIDQGATPNTDNGLEVVPPAGTGHGNFNYGAVGNPPNPQTDPDAFIQWYENYSKQLGREMRPADFAPTNAGEDAYSSAIALRLAGITRPDANRQDSVKKRAALKDALNVRNSHDTGEHWQGWAAAADPNAPRMNLVTAGNGQNTDGNRNAPYTNNFVWTGSSYTITLTNPNGTPYANQTVTLSFTRPDGTTGSYQATTDANGKIKYDILENTQIGTWKFQLSTNTHDYGTYTMNVMNKPATQFVMPGWSPGFPALNLHDPTVMWDYTHGPEFNLVADRIPDLNRNGVLDDDEIIHYYYSQYIYDPMVQYWFGQSAEWNQAMGTGINPYSFGPNSPFVRFLTNYYGGDPTDPGNQPAQQQQNTPAQAPIQPSTPAPLQPSNPQNTNPTGQTAVQVTSVNFNAATIAQGGSFTSTISGNFPQNTSFTAVFNYNGQNQPPVANWQIGSTKTHSVPDNYPTGTYALRQLLVNGQVVWSGNLAIVISQKNQQQNPVNATGQTDAQGRPLGVQGNRYIWGYLDNGTPIWSPSVPTST